MLAIRNFRQEPNATLRLVDPDFNETGRADIVMLITALVRLAHEFDQPLIVGGQLEHHMCGRNGRFVVVLQTLVVGYVTDRSKRTSPEFACALGDVVRHAEDLLALFVEQKEIVPEMATGHVPVEVLGLQIKREDVGQELAKVGRDSGNGVAAEVAGLTVTCPLSP